MKLVKDLGMQFPRETSKAKKRYCLFICPDCGSEVKLAKDKGILAERCKDCSYKLMKKKSSTHGLSYTKLYKSFKAMHSRCYNKKNKSYKYYGAIGVTVCEEWKSVESFSLWAKANGYKEGLVITRHGDTGNYEPNNCSWKTRAENTREMVNRGNQYKKSNKYAYESES